MPFHLAICSSPDCTQFATAPRGEALPDTCADCGAAMVQECWKCESAVTDATASYCAACGVPLKRVLPRREAAAAHLVLVCSDPECDWASAGVPAMAMPTRCPECGTEVTTDCWKCGARITDIRQLYCGVCGVPLKRGRRTIAADSRRAYA
jgi:predicted amidophosphoribosyltransferase